MQLVILVWISYLKAVPSRKCPQVFFYLDTLTFSTVLFGHLYFDNWCIWSFLSGSHIRRLYLLGTTALKYWNPSPWVRNRVRIRFRMPWLCTDTVRKKKSAPDPFWKKKCQIRFFYLEVRIRMNSIRICNPLVRIPILHRIRIRTGPNFFPSPLRPKNSSSPR